MTCQQRVEVDPGRPRRRAAPARACARSPPRRALLMTLTVWPWPSRADVDDQLAHHLEQRPGARPTSAAAPPAMIVSVPASAFGDEPVTGASTKRVPALGERVGEPRARRRARSSTCRRTACPSRAPASAPSSPSSTASTCGAVDDHRDHDVGCARRPRAGEAATVPPCSAAHASARSRVRLKTVSSWPACARFAAMREPMIPGPTKPTGLTRPWPPPPGVSIRSRCPARSVAGRLRRQLLAVEQVAPARARLAAVRARRRVAAALGDERVGHVLERLDLAHDAVAAAVLAGAARAAAQRVARRRAAGTRARAPRPAC